MTCLPRGLTARWVWLTLLVAFIGWHTAFDIRVNGGLRAYVAEHARYAAGQGPLVTIRGIMDEAVARGTRDGFIAAALVLSGSAAMWVIIERRRKRSASDSAVLR